jgi:hypothetical protein
MYLDEKKVGAWNEANTKILVLNFCVLADVGLKGGSNHSLISNMK